MLYHRSFSNSHGGTGPQAIKKAVEKGLDYRTETHSDWQLDKFHSDALLQSISGSLYFRPNHRSDSGSGRGNF